MTATVGGNLNTNTEAFTTAYELNGVTATKIADLKGEVGRIYFGVALEPGLTNVGVIIRLYPAGDDNNLIGIPLFRDSSGNTNFFYPIWEMNTHAIYLGEISAITTGGTVTVYVTEF